MKKILFLLLIVAISSCSTEAPKEDEVKNLVKLWYEQQSTGGNGKWDVNGVTVLSIKEDKERDDVFITTSHVTGIRKHGIPAEQWLQPKPDEKFSDTLRMDLTWNGAKWITAQ